MRSMQLKRFGWGWALMLLMFSFGCTKNSIEQKCCESEYEIITQNYNPGSDFKLWIPQAFTPNGDGHNDQFRPLGTGFDIHRIVIRKGSKAVYETNRHLGHFWDGGDEKDGRYTYEMKLKLKSGDFIELEGELCLMRYESVGSNLFDVEKDKACQCIFEDMIDLKSGPTKDTKECPSGTTVYDEETTEEES